MCMSIIDIYDTFCDEPKPSMLRAGSTLVFLCCCLKPGSACFICTPSPGWGVEAQTPPASIGGVLHEFASNYFSMNTNVVA